MMAKDSELYPRLHDALNLDGSAHSVKDFYAGWAEKYDRDCADWKYSATDRTLSLLGSLHKIDDLRVDPQDKNISIMDVGCGTGLLGAALNSVGYKNIDGCDISTEMVEIARNLKIYTSLYGNIDINDPVKDKWRHRYDCCVSVGVFTPGHVPPESLCQLIAMTKPGGIIIVSTRVAYYESENYQAIADRLEIEGKIKLLKVEKDADYTYDSKAHYWAYVTLAKDPEFQARPSRVRE